ncbi:hypothetical protein P3W85_00190 [Cupriavidus basilensis]|uniref:Lipoprotein n=1 Tax=Cupriavidus basilensis TaxID=68895 RepID=A0ABT6AGD4_9BURK|nr:hypothetical protein [Cupriavidus basilensis]MDF3831387.1 hypothetical protein [Cupriavidus basilensis]
MKTLMIGLVVAGAAMLGGCAVYPAYPAYGGDVGVAVAPAPVYAPPVVVAPGFYGGYYGYHGYGGRRYRYWR